MTRVAPGYTRHMSDSEIPPPEDADRLLSDDEDDLDPEAPTDSAAVHPPRDDADRPVEPADDLDELLQEENAGTSLDQPSDQTS